MVDSVQKKPLKTSKKPTRRRFVWVTIWTAISAIATALYLFLPKDGGHKQVASKSGNVQQNQETSEPVQINSTTTGGTTNIIVPDQQGRVLGVSSVFSSAFDKTEDWSFSEGLRTEKDITSYVGSGQPALNLTSKSFSQTNTYTVTFVPITSAPDLVLRVENSFDIRFGDGSPWEVALYKFAREGNWKPVVPEKTNTDRLVRWKLPCALVVGNAVTVTINVNTTGSSRKDVLLSYQYQCQNGTFITPEDEKFQTAHWSFTIPQFDSAPVRFGVGINDPSGKDHAKVQINSVNIDNN